MAVDRKAVRAMAAACTAARNSGSPEAVASFHAPDGHIVISRGEPWVGRKGIAEMAAGFLADVPDLKLVRDQVRCAGKHVAYVRAFTGTHAATKNPPRVAGRDEWDPDPDRRVVASRGRYDAADYERQTAPRSRHRAPGLT